MCHYHHIEASFLASFVFVNCSFYHCSLLLKFFGLSLPLWLWWNCLAATFASTTEKRGVLSSLGYHVVVLSKRTRQFLDEKDEGEGHIC